VIRRFDHIGIAVRSLEESLPFWADALGMRVAGMETVKDEQVKVAFLTVGNSRIELLEATAPDSAIARSIEKRGPGVHHVTLEVTDLEATLTRLRSRGVSILGDAVRSGAGGRSVAFVHPRSAGGVLVELVQERVVRHDADDLGPGSAVLLYLRDPSEKQWGVLRRLDSTGVIAEALDLGSFDDWIRQIERGDENVVGPSVVFVPMSRVDKIFLDRSSGELPSLAERFVRRVGRTVQEVLGGDDLAGFGGVE
jgi:methylmalonyl-CoA/ethylmalonyl-CoA epimerase